MDEVTRGRRKLDNEQLHHLYSMPNMLIMITSRRMRRAGHAARMGRGMHTGFGLESQKVKDH
jgi:hypothetical protein